METKTKTAAFTELNIYGVQAYKSGYGLVYSFKVAAPGEEDAKRIARGAIAQGRSDGWTGYDIRVRKTKDKVYAEAND